MINIIIESDNEEEMKKMKEDFHYALTGSPAYIESEIAICDRDDKSFYFIIGNNNKSNITKIINTKDIKIGNE